MSWDIFKQNIKRAVDNPDSISNIDSVADLYATEYDNAIRRGRDSLNLVSIQQGNIESMRETFRISLRLGSNTKSPTFQLINEFGKGIISYWIGATLQLIPIPIIPAPGSLQNISVITNVVTFPGTWPPSPPLSAQNNTSTFLDIFVSTATTHLQTVSGVVNTISLYPAFPVSVPAPGVLPWSGYVV